MFETYRNFSHKNVYVLCSTIVRVIKSRIIRWEGHVARMEREEACAGFRWRNLRERNHWGDPGIDGRLILKRIFRT
jgi:hypothetical protein